MKYLLQQRCRTTRSCRHKALLSSSRPDSIEKDSKSARRADCSRQRQARLHTVGFGLARAGGPIASLRAEWPKASLLCGTQVTRVRIDGAVIYSFISQGPTVKYIRVVTQSQIQFGTDSENTIFALFWLDNPSN